MRTAWLVGILLLVLAGCISSPQEATQDSVVKRVAAPLPRAVSADSYPITCVVVDATNESIPSARCAYSFPSLKTTVNVDPKALVGYSVKSGDVGTVEASAPGFGAKSVAFLVDAPKVARFVLEPGAAPSQSVLPARAWMEPLTITTAQYVEPLMASDSQGTLYYSPIPTILRSDDGGLTWTDITPEALAGEESPEFASDTSISIAPDDSLWFTRFWPYLGPTVACVSTDRGDSWTCDHVALPGGTDRMWVAGLDDQNAYLHATGGFYTRQWAVTENGATKFLPIGYQQGGALGNIVYVPQTKAVWQVDWENPLGLLRVDEISGTTIPRIETPVARTQAISTLSVSPEGYLWLTGEPTVEDDPGSGRVSVAARSADGGKTWQQFQVSNEPATVTHTYVASAEDGRVAVVYYGGDRPGPAGSTYGNWSLYVAETSNGNDAFPTWVETRVVDKVHEGVLCTGLGCGETEGDNAGRYSLDLIGITITPDGNVHVAFADDTKPEEEGVYLNRAQYARQTLLPLT